MLQDSIVVMMPYLANKVSGSDSVIIVMLEAAGPCAVANVELRGDLGVVKSGSIRGNTVISLSGTVLPEQY